MACTAASTTILSSSSTSRSYISPKSSSSISKSFSQNLTVPTSFNAFPKSILSHSPRSISFSSKSQSRSSSFVVRCGVLPLVGNVAPDFEAEAVFDQEFIKVKNSSTFPPLSRPRNIHNLPPLSTETTSVISPPPIPPKTPLKPLPQNPNSESEDKLLFFDSLGIDYFSLLNTHPPLVSASIADIKSIVSYLSSDGVGLTPPDLHRAINMCPEIITAPVSSVVSALTFLLRDVGVEGRELRGIIWRRPRLLACSVENRLRPTLYFLQGTIGIDDLRRHTHLLSCSVETKFLPRVDYFEKVGFSYEDTITMFRRFPSLFCYSIEENLEPKFNYFVVKMGRDLKELKEFPQYFSFSLEYRIKPRHQHCVEKGVCLSLPIMLKSNEVRFRDRLKVYCSSTMPVRTSPLWCIKHDDNVL